MQTVYNINLQTKRRVSKVINSVENKMWNDISLQFVQVVQMSCTNLVLRRKRKKARK